MAALALHDALADPDLGDELEPREHRPHERHPAVGLREEQARDDQISAEPQQLLAGVARAGPQRAAQRARVELGVVHPGSRRERAASVAAVATKTAQPSGPRRISAPSTRLLVTSHARNASGHKAPAPGACSARRTARTSASANGTQNATSPTTPRSSATSRKPL